MPFKKEFKSFKYSLDELLFNKADGSDLVIKRGDKLALNYVNENIEFKQSISYLIRYDYDVNSRSASNKKVLTLYFAESLDDEEENYIVMNFGNIISAIMVEAYVTVLADPKTNDYSNPAIGDLTKLATNNKVDIVTAINELNTIVNETDGARYTSDLLQNKAIYNVGTASDGTNLTSSIIEGQVMPAIKGNTIRNGVKNGNFYLGGSYWSVASGTAAIANNIMTLTGNGTLDYVRALSDGNTHAYINAHKYYMAFTFKAKTSLCVSVMARIVDEAVGNVITKSILTNPVANTLYKLSNIFTTSANGTGRTRIIIDSVYTNAANSNGSAVEISNVMCIDLTQIYGAGNEPTAVQFEALLNGYVDGLSGISSLVVKSITKNMFNKDIITKGSYLSNSSSVVDSSWCLTTYLLVKGGTNYTVSGRTSSSVSCVIRFYDVNGATISETAHTNSTSQIYTTPVGCKYLRESLLLTDLSTFQIEEGYTATSYEEYEESTMEVPTLYKLPNGVYDEILDDGTLIKRIGEKTLTASDIVGFNSAMTAIDAIIIAPSVFSDMINVGINDGVCTKVNTSISSPRNGEGSYDSISTVWRHGYDGTYLYINIQKSLYSTFALAQAGLAGTKIIYELATPVITLNAVTPLTVYPKGTISLNSSIIPETTISYPVDVAGVIKNLNLAVTALSEGANVVDSFASADPRKALSARKGKELYDGTAYISGTPTLASGIIIQSAFTLRKKCGVVFLTFNVTRESLAVFDGRYTLFTLPVGFRPYAMIAVAIPAQTIVNSVMNRTALIYIDANGNVISDIVTTDCKQYLGAITFNVD